ncbi:hypothetical protein ACFPH6_36500 [Streptomyces xiangluensis]|uniref:Uncharacterized protein n=1 Tax=Streptomyces xiangluensis TaxID=2665720 RepID=A0ABV8Z084_9ACTN
MTTPTKLAPAPVIDETARLLTEHYVFPEIAEQLAGLLQRRLTEGAYDVDDAEELAAWSPRTCSPSTATGT